MDKTKNLLPPWKPGESGNRNGRPRGKSVTKHLLELLEKKVNAPKGAISVDSEKVTISQGIAIKLLEKAIRGDLEAIKEVQNRTEGKSKEIVINETTVLSYDERVRRLHDLLEGCSDDFLD